MTEEFSFPTVFIKLSTVYYLNMLWWTFEVAKMFFRRCCMFSKIGVRKMPQIPIVFQLRTLYFLFHLVS